MDNQNYANSSNTTLKVIQFYREGEVPHGCFSNFSKHEVDLDGKVWPTSEHYFQAKKFQSEEIQETIRKASSPGDAKQLGRNRSYPLRKDWEEVKDDLMFKVCLAKFSQHPELKKIILGTGDSKLVEHTSNDNYWGDGGDGSGKNMLGQTLMKVREALVKEKGK